MAEIHDRDAYPLDWPDGWPRTEPRDRARARYTVSFEKAPRELGGRHGR